jgi:insertion element IS1 protein InsB
MMSTVTCPSCQSGNVVKYGRIHNGKRRYICYDCHRQFTPDAQKKYISAEEKKLVDKMLSEKVSIAAISRVTGISKSWLYRYVKSKGSHLSQHLDMAPDQKDAS